MKFPNIKIVCTFLLLGMFVTGCGQNEKILFALDNTSNLQKNFIKKNNLQVVTIFYQVDFAPDGSFDQKKFLSAMATKIPNVNQTGYAVLDWEGDKEIALNTQKIETEVVKAQRDFVDVIKLAKKLRPKMKWSYYGFPTTNFWTPYGSWEDRNLRLNDLFLQLDFFAPSLYLFYPNTELSSLLTDNYLKRNLSLAFKLGQKYKKEVIPFIWHRYHPSNEKNGLKLVNEQDFTNYSKLLFNYSDYGLKINKVIWWNAENFYYNSRAQYPNIKKEFENVQPDVHQAQVLSTYLKYIQQGL